MKDILKIRGGVAVITGAASGIGAALARHAASLGMRLALADWNEDDLEKVARSLPCEVVAMRTDVSSEKDVVALADRTYKEFGQVDLLFNNAGVLSSGQCWEIDAETWEKSLSINVGGVVNGIRTFVPRLIDAYRPARIINTASVGGFFSAPLMSPYTASKFAVVSITETLAVELAAIGSNVAVSLLAPGAVKTNILKGSAPIESERLIEKMRNMTSERGVDPDEIAAFAFTGIENSEFWLIPQPASLDSRVRDRTDMILSRRSPAARYSR